MSAIAKELPEEVKIARDGILAFAEQEVIARHDANKAFLRTHVACTERMVDFLTSLSS